MSNTLYIIRGVPGSGKSTLANKMSAETGGNVWEADLFMTDNEGNYKFDPLRLKECHQKCQRGVCADMYFGVSNIYVANTFIKKWEAEVYYTLAKVWGYDVKVILCEGNYDNVHGVPQDRVNIMRANMEPYENQTIITKE